MFSGKGTTNCTGSTLPTLRPTANNKMLALVSSCQATEEVMFALMMLQGVPNGETCCEEVPLADTCTGCREQGAGNPCELQVSPAF